MRFEAIFASSLQCLKTLQNWFPRYVSLVAIFFFFVAAGESDMKSTSLIANYTSFLRDREGGEAGGSCWHPTFVKKENKQI